MAEHDEKEPGALDTGRATAIAQLSPEIHDAQTCFVDGVVTITWPFSIITKSVAFILAEPDFRLRNDRGQVRVEFDGAAGKALADAGVGGGDEVRLSLQGAEWEPHQSKTRLPGTPLDWQIKFTNRLVLRFRRADSAETVTVDVDGPVIPASDEPENPIEVIAASSPLLSPMLASTTRARSPPLTAHGKRTATASLDPDEYASPAFLKRARVSYGSLFEGGIEDIDKDARRNGNTKKRSRFSMGGMGWRYSSKSPSPEPEHVDELEEPFELEQEEILQGKASTDALGSSSMVDEGSQTQWPSARESEMPQEVPFSSFVPPTPTPLGGSRMVQGQNATTNIDNATADNVQSPLRISNSQSVTYGQANNLFSTQPPLNSFVAAQHDLSELPSTTISSSHEFSVAAIGGGTGLAIHHDEIPIPENMFGGLPITAQSPGQSLFDTHSAAGLGWQSEADSHPVITADSHSLERELGANVYPDPDLDGQHHQVSHELEEPRRTNSMRHAIEYEEDGMSKKSEEEDSARQEVEPRHLAGDVDVGSSVDGEDDEDNRTAYEVQETDRLRREREGYDLSEDREEEHYNEEEHYDESEEEEGRSDHRNYARYEQEDEDEDEGEEEGEEEDEEWSESNEDDEEDGGPELDHRTPASQSTSSQQVVIDLISDSEDEDSAPPPAPREPLPPASSQETTAIGGKDLEKSTETENETEHLDRNPSPGVTDDADTGGNVGAEGDDTKSVGSVEDEQIEQLKSSEEADQDESNMEPSEAAIRERNEPMTMDEVHEDESGEEEGEEEEEEEEEDEAEDVEMVEFREPHGIESRSADESEAGENIVSGTIDSLREPTPQPALREDAEEPEEDPMAVDEASADDHIITQEQVTERSQHIEEHELVYSDAPKQTTNKSESTLQKTISPPPTQATLRLSQEEGLTANQPALGHLPTPSETQLPPEEMVSEFEQPSASGIAAKERAVETEPRRSSRRKLDRPDEEKLETDVQDEPQQEDAGELAEKSVDRAVLESVEARIDEAAAEKPNSSTNEDAADREQDDSLAAEEQIIEEFLQYHSPTPKSKPQAEAEPLITVHSLRSHDKDTAEDTAHDAGEVTNISLVEGPRLRSKREAGLAQKQGKDELAAPLSPRRHRKTRSTDSTKSQAVQPRDREPSSPKEIKSPARPTRMVRATRSKASKDDPSIALAQSIPQEEKPRDASPPLHRPVTRSMDDILEAGSEAETAPSTRMTRRHATPEVTELAHGPSTPTQIMDYIESTAASEEEEPALEAEVAAQSIDDGAEASQAEPKKGSAGSSMTKDELLKHLKSKLPDYLRLDKLSRARDQQCDILAVAASTPDRAKRPRHGPRDYMLEVALTDPSLSSSSVRIAQFYRPHIRALPVVEVGDVVMLRKVDVLAMRGRDFGVRIASESAWAVYQKSSEELLPQINGPPVEGITDEEVGYVRGLRSWWDSLDVEVLREAEEAAEKSLHVAQQDEGDE